MAYMTSQRKLLYETLEKHRDKAFTADEITALVGNTTSRSAVYRNLASLEKQGLVKKTTAVGSNKTLYRYTGSKECKDHLHLECSKCGKTYHLKVPTTNAVIESVMQDADFQIDRCCTVLYGICVNCRGN